jgi:hypothetical protein
VHDWNREPLAPNAYARLPLGSVQACGWLHEQLRLAADGLTGHLMDIWPDVGPTSGWLGGGGENWERGPYYLRGLLALAHVLRDERLIARSLPWVEWSLASQQPDGFFGPLDNDDWWPRMPMLEALRLHHEATGDARVVPFMTRYLRCQGERLGSRPLEAWGRPRGGDNIDSVLWLYNRTGDTALLALADLLHRQTSDWLGELGGDGPPNEAFDFGHGVNRAMGLKEPVVYFQRTRDPAYLAAFRKGWQRTLAHHGQIQGTFSGDEFLHGTGSTQGTELCTVVELLSSFETALRISGALWLADAIERIAYNALPAMLSADHRGHQYFQLPNQVECTPGGRNFHVHHDNDLLFGPLTGYGCCAANYHMGWPLLTRHLWWATPDGGLAALLLGPCTLTVRLAGGHAASIVEDTEYPFEPEVRFAMRLAAPLAFPLRVRVPAWAEEFTLTLNGTPVPVEQVCGAPAAPSEPRLITLRRTWNDGDILVLGLQCAIRLSRWERGSVGVERGPLVYALRIGEQWRAVGGHASFPDYELRPTTPWNYGLAVDPPAAERSFRIERQPLGRQPWAQDGASVRLVIPARRLPQWTVVNGVSGPIPVPPIAADSPLERVTLIPFGSARLRISMFPLIT